MAKMPGTEVSNFSVSTGIRFSLRLRPQSATGPSFMVRPKNGSMRVQGTSTSPSAALDGRGASWPSSPFEAGHLADLEVEIFPSLPCAFILLTLSGAARNSSRRCTSVTLLGDRLQVERPVERRIAAADDHQVVAAEILHAAHRVEDRLALIGLDARDRRPLRLERAAAGGDHHDLGHEHLVCVGGQRGSGRRRAFRGWRPCG